MDIKKVLLLELGGGLLPFSIDFTTAPSIPGLFTGGTYFLSGGHLYNNPTLGAEKLPNPTLEGIYVLGLAPNVTETDPDLDATPFEENVIVRPGSTAAQGFTTGDIGDFLLMNASAAVADTWYQMSGWFIRTVGSDATGTVMFVFQSGILPDASNHNLAEINGAAYTLLKTAYYSPNTNVPGFRFINRVGGSANNTSIADDISLKPITRSSFYLLADWGILNGTFGIKLGTFADHSPVGLVLRAGSASDPTNCVYCWIQKQPRAPTSALVYIMKKLSTTTSVVLSVQVVTIVAGAWFEAVVSGTSFQLKYNNVNVSTPQAIADANLNLAGSTFAGIWSTGDNPIDAFRVIPG